MDVKINQWYCLGQLQISEKPKHIGKVITSDDFKRLMKALPIELSSNWYDLVCVYLWAQTSHREWWSM